MPQTELISHIKSKLPQITEDYEMKQEKQMRRNITISDRLYKRAKQISKQNGNKSPSYSEGIRIAIEAYEVKR